MNNILITAATLICLALPVSGQMSGQMSGRATDPDAIRIQQQKTKQIDK